MVDLKGIEPSNLTDANRALSRACRIRSKNGEKNKNERKDRRMNLFPLFNMQDKLNLQRFYLRKSNSKSLSDKRVFLSA